MTTTLAQPRRIMRSRRKGFRMPQGAIYVGRPTVLGNPFQVARFGHKAAVLMHAEWLRFNLGALFLERRGFSPVEIEAIERLRERALARLPDLHGRDLACWCALTAPCHADTLLELAR